MLPFCLKLFSDITGFWIKYNYLDSPKIFCYKTHSKNIITEDFLYSELSFYLELSTYMGV